MKRILWYATVFVLASNFCLCFGEIQYPIKGSSGETLLGFGLIQRADVSPDGKYLATVNPMGVYLWDIQRDEAVHYYPFQDIQNSEYSMKFSPDSKNILVVGDNPELKGYLLDVQSGNIIKSFTHPLFYSNEIHFFPNNKEIFVYINAKASVYDIFQEKITRQYSSILGISYSEVSSDGKFIAQRYKNTITLYDVVTEAVITQLSGNAMAISSGQKICISPNNQYVLIPGCIWDIKSEEPLYQFPDVDASRYSGISCSFTPDSKQVLLTDEIKGSVLYDIQTWNATPVFLTDSTATQNVTKTDYTVSTMKPFQSPIDGNLSPVKPFCPSLESLIFAEITSDGKYGVTCNSGSSTIWDMKTLKVIRQMKGHNYNSYSYDISPDGKQIATLDQLDDTAVLIKIWDRKIGKIVNDFKVLIPSCHSLWFLPDGNSIMVKTGSEVKICNIASGAVIQSVSHLMLATCSPDGTKIAGMMSEDDFVMLNIPSGEIVKTWSGLPSDSKQIRFFPDGKKILVETDNANFSIWNAETGEKLSSFAFPTTGFYISSDTRFILFSNGTKQNIYNVELAKIEKSFTASVSSFTFSSEDKGYWTDNKDNNALNYWDGVKNTKINLKIGSSFFTLSKDGTVLATMAYDSPVRVWNLSEIRSAVNEWAKF